MCRRISDAIEHLGWSSRYVCHVKFIIYILLLYHRSTILESYFCVQPDILLTKWRFYPEPDTWSVFCRDSRVQFFLDVVAHSPRLFKEARRPGGLPALPVPRNAGSSLLRSIRDRTCEAEHQAFSRELTQTLPCEIMTFSAPSSDTGFLNTGNTALHSTGHTVVVIGSSTACCVTDIKE
jgi:hypothetical protein